MFHFHVSNFQATHMLILYWFNSVNKSFLYLYMVGYLTVALLARCLPIFEGKAMFVQLYEYFIAFLPY